MTEILAIIPARGGSKGIPRKNVKLILNKPVLAYSIEHAKQTAAITRVVVSTDDGEIAAVAQQYGAEVVWRPADISGDGATSESALQHTLDYLEEHENYVPDLVVFLQATSPIRQPDDISNALTLLEQEDGDSLLSVCLVHGFVWREEKGNIQSFTYDYHNRARRQDAPIDYTENGSIYIFKPSILREQNNRLGGKILLYEMNPLDSFQIDEPNDLALIAHLLPLRRPFSNRPDFSQVELLVLDFDGVLTDNRVHLNQEGVESVVCHRGDGWGISQLRQAGLPIMILSTETNQVVSARAQKLQVPVIQSSDDKGRDIELIAKQYDVSVENIAFLGNDLNDMPALERVGYPLAVADAETAVKQIVCWTTDHNGGYGAVRELCDHIRKDKYGKTNQNR